MTKNGGFNVYFNVEVSDEENRPAAASRSRNPQSQGVPGRRRPAAVLPAERPAGPPAHRHVLQQQPVQTAEGLLLPIAASSASVLDIVVPCGTELQDPASWTGIVSGVIGNFGTND
ncbi:unnamed protein product [Pleuronectes platessa]|uniref:Uncharacterized protein n=1 Tax=Pleuronectes platessa TaxID=8262 RepID=A0A9N7VPU8_PLEPL|nr:unnamed protein product [Pleuronectes platessa]